MPNGFCTFDLAVTGAELSAMLHQWPLSLQLFRRDRYANDELIGTGVVPMAKVLKAPLYYRCKESAKTFSTYESWQKHAAGRCGGVVGC